MEHEGKTQKKNTAPAQATVVLRLIAGGYLLYLVYGLVPGVLAETGSLMILKAAITVLFLIVGTILLGWSLMKLIKGEFIRPGQMPDDDDTHEQET